MTDVKHTKPAGRSFRIPAGSIWDHAWKMSAAVAVVGVLVTVAGAFLQTDRFAYSYLYGFITALTFWLGSVFFILIQHLTGAGWSVTVRRTAEFFAGGVIVLPILFLPIATQFDHLYPWWDHGHHESGVAHAQENQPTHGAPKAPDDPMRHIQGGTAPDPHNDATSAAHDAGHGSHEAHHHIEEILMSKKTWYLNQPFFFIRLFLYFGVWLWLGLTLFGKSVAQDRTADKQLTVQLQRFAAPATFLFALTLTFAGIDWVMSLEPLWYSTMFGVRVFASSAVTSFAVIILFTLGFKRAGLIGDEINTEHYHDLGKLMFGFLIFWGYISFSEFFLIWYAAIPEETVYFHRRWDDASWRTLSTMIVVLKFIVPFYLTMSRNAKRNNAVIGFGAAWLIALHFLEIYYWIMPNFAPFKPVQWAGMWLEAGCVMATVGIYLTYVLYRMRQHSLIPVGDPRLSRALDFQQV